MCIAIGSLVDDAIVDVENVYRRLRLNRMLPKAEQSSVIEVIFEASKEVRLPILNSTLIIIASFVPIFFLSGMEGRMLQPLGVAFIVALLAIKFFISYVTKYGFKAFGYYRIIVGAAIIIMGLCGISMEV